MAWRDSRRNRGRLFLFVSSIILGIAALVAISSFGENLQTDINKEAMPDSINEKIKYIEEERSDVVSFASMVYLPKTDDTRMVQVNALQGNYPYYGEFSTEPSNARSGFAGAVLPVVYIPKQFLEATELVQFGSRVDYNYFYKLKEGLEGKNLVDTLEATLRPASMGYDTVEGFYSINFRLYWSG